MEVPLGSLGLIWVDMGDMVTKIDRDIFPISRDPLDPLDLIR